MLAAAMLETTAAPSEAPNSWKVLTMPETSPRLVRVHVPERGPGGDHEVPHLVSDTVLAAYAPQT
jgi:hypothetical protein